MPDASGLGLQAALRAALEALMPIAVGGVSTTVPVHDNVPQDLAGLYIQIGSDTGVPAGAKSFDAVAHTLDILVYSGHRGLRDVKQVIDAIYDGLQGATLVVAGVQVSHLSHRFSDAFTVPDGSQGVIRFETTTY